MNHWIITTELSKSCYRVIPKSASSSIRVTLVDSKIEETNDLPLESMLKWTIVRNPYNRLHSCWCSKVRWPLLNNNQYELIRYIHEGASWKDFVEMVVGTRDEDADQHFAAQQFLLDSLSFVPDVLIKLEDIDTAWPPFAKRMGFNPLFAAVNVLRPDKNNHAIRLHYTESMRLKVAERYRMDFERFGYSTKF